MKRTKQCPKCESRRIGYIPLQPDAEDSVPLGDQHRAERYTNKPTRAIGHGGITNTGILSFGKVRWLVGGLEAYICTDCGYHESYAIEPHVVPWDKIEGFAWVNPDAIETGPFR